MSSRFGNQLLPDFPLAKSWLNINHGSFGTHPLSVRTALHHFQDLAEARPDRFIRWDYHQHLRKSRNLVATHLNAPYESCVFVANATTGFNIVLRNLVFEPGDVVVTFAAIYGACGNTIEYVCDTTPLECVLVDITYPIEDDDLVDRFRDVVKREQEVGKRVRLAVFDTIVSNPGVRMPFERLTEACRELGVMSMIDGAHGIGQAELDLTALDPDFFITNCHKWLFTPRGCAVFYCPPRNQALMRSTLPTSWGIPPLTGPLLPRGPHNPPDESPFERNFNFIGSGDFAPYLCVPAAFEYRASIGGEAAIREYCETLARDGGLRVAAALGTEVLDNASHSLTKCFMTNIRLPVSLDTCQRIASTTSIPPSRVPYKVRTWLERAISRDHDSFMAVFEYSGGLWARLSAAVYLELKDFDTAAAILKDVSERAVKGEWVLEHEAEEREAAGQSD